MLEVLKELQKQIEQIYDTSGMDYNTEIEESMVKVRKLIREMESEQYSDPVPNNPSDHE